MVSGIESNSARSRVGVVMLGLRWDVEYGRAEEE